MGPGDTISRITSVFWLHTASGVLSVTNVSKITFYRRRRGVKRDLQLENSIQANRNTHIYIMKQEALRCERGSQWNSFFPSLQSTSLYSKGFFV